MLRTHTVQLHFMVDDIMKLLIILQTDLKAYNLVIYDCDPSGSQGGWPLFSFGASKEELETYIQDRYLADPEHVSYEQAYKDKLKARIREYDGK